MNVTSRTETISRVEHDQYEFTIEPTEAEIVPVFRPAPVDEFAVLSLSVTRRKDDADEIMKVVCFGLMPLLDGQTTASTIGTTYASGSGRFKSTGSLGDMPEWLKSFIRDNTPLGDLMDRLATA